jgi:predicted O-linked N-acetylglucosamine transferase (SPINDLY family)
VPDRGRDHPLRAYWLAAALGAAGDWRGHHEALRLARTEHAVAVMESCNVDFARLDSDLAYALQVAETFYAHNHVAVAATAYGRALALPQAPLSALVGYGLAMQHQGRIEEAVAAFSRVCELSGDATVHGFLLYALFYVEDGVRRHAEEARRWAATHYDHLLSQAPDFANPPLQDRPLRLGYVAPVVTSGQLRQFLAPVFEHHDPARVEVSLYLKDDPGAAAPANARVRVIGGLDDAAAAQLIRDDGIDVLVDLWGHTVNGRLGVFARKAAPVQVSWMNYLQTTGLAAIDYVLHSDGLAEPNAQDHFVEKIWHMGPAIAPFRPDPRPDPAPTPARANGFVTFGSYNHPARLNDQTVAAWAAILNRTPGSQLVLRYRFFDDAVLQNATLMRFAAHGVDPERITFKGHTVQPEYYESYREIDIALDPSPCPGGTTSNDALANGMPLLTLKGDTYFSRLGSALVEPLGVPELVVETWEDYVDRAVELASDIAALDALRLRVRVGFDLFEDREEVGFTRRLEGIFRDMFLRWQEARARSAA